MSDAEFLTLLSVLTFDTHKIVKRLTAAGLPSGQAEAIVESLSDLDTTQIATKADLKDLEQATKASLKDLEQATKAELREMEIRLIRAMFTQSFATIGITAGLVAAIVGWVVS